MTSSMSSQAQIGVFDSGVGGLTVLREMYRLLPNESVLYFGDTARLPYGTRSAPEITQFVREIIVWMLSQGVKLVLMACNTSSALALETVQAEFDVPILGIIQPGAEAAVQHGKRVGVIATPATAASNAYRRAITSVDETVKVWQVGCPEFVPLIEQNQIDHPLTREIAQEYLAPLLAQQIDTLVYGCTHYPHLEPVLRSLVPNSVRFVDPARYAVIKTAQVLDEQQLRSHSLPSPTRFCVSGNPSQFAHLSKQWLGCTPIVESVVLPPVRRQPMRPYSQSLEAS